jgi:hypothetical protein
MACNCGKNRQQAAQPRRAVASGSTQQFALVKRDGSKEEFGSRLEADAANVRAGYTGVVKPVAVR